MASGSRPCDDGGAMYGYLALQGQGGSGVPVWYALRNVMVLGCRGRGLLSKTRSASGRLLSCLSSLLKSHRDGRILDTVVIMYFLSSRAHNQLTTAVIAYQGKYLVYRTGKLTELGLWVPTHTAPNHEQDASTSVIPSSPPLVCHGWRCTLTQASHCQASPPVRCLASALRSHESRSHGFLHLRPLALTDETQAPSR